MVLSLADFIEYLRQRDFNVGVEHLLRAQILLDTIDQDYSSPESLKRLHQEQTAEIKDQPPDKLKTRLCPLFASNREEQRRFYKAFDDYVSYLELKHATTETQTQSPPKGRRHNWKWSAIAFAILVAISVAIILLIEFPRQPQPGLAATADPSPNVSPVSTLSPTPTHPPVSATPPITATSPSLTPTPSPTPSPSPVWQPPAGRAYVAVFALGMILFLVYELAIYLNRHRLLHTQSSKSPPFSWPLAVKRPAVKLYRSDQFFQAVRRLRRRRIREFHRLNIYATIAATVRSLGYPSFRYKPDSNIPEYLMLIDRRSYRDHQAHLFNELFKALKLDGLYITRFFYDRDPRRCFDETGKNFQHLSELRAKYFDHRILIFGDCDKLLDPKTGKLAEWVEIFSAWHDRAILSPITPALWGFRETNLVTQFSILPATVAGLNELSDTFAPPITRELGDWKTSEGDVLPRALNAENVVAELRPRLGEDVFQWLCACALYPELQWNLTLLIGSLSCMKVDLITEENLLRLVRLPWFSAGMIPEDVRLALSQAIDHEKETNVRAMIVELLAKDEPPSGTFAADTYSVELALQQWLISRVPENLRRLRLALKNIPANEIVNDRLLVTHLKRVPTSVMSRLIPPPLRQKLYKYGLPYFGFKSATHFLMMLLIVVLVSLGMRAGAIPVFYPKVTPEASPSPDQPSGTTVSVREPTMLSSPDSAKRGSDFQMTITFEQCIPGKFDDATLEAPVGIKINSTSISEDRCSFTARITIPANTPLGAVEFSLKRPIGTTQIPFTVTAVDCPKVTIAESKEGGNYRFTAVVVGGQPLSQPRFVWKAVGRDQQGQSIIDDPVPFTGQGTSSILIQEKDNNDSGIYLMVDVTVTGYDSSCRVNASGGGFPDESPSPTTNELVALPKSIVLPCPNGSTPATCSSTGPVVNLSINDSVSGNLLWSVSGGKITDRGSTAIWDLTGAQQGTYTAVVAQNVNGSTTNRWSTNVRVENCKDCNPVGQCPVISMSCPTEVREGDLLTFTGNLSGSFSTFKYKWSVSNGKITSGTETLSINVDTNGLANQTITAALQIDGLAEQCASSWSCTTSIRAASGSSGCNKFDEYGNIRFDDQQARLDNFVITLQTDPAATGYIIVHAIKNDRQNRSNQINNYLKRRRFDTRRIKIINGPTRSSLTVELWICPPGAQP
jgi:hypothetical protein